MLAMPTTLPDCRPVLADPDDLRLVFQPIVDLTSATVAGYEALPRFPGTSGPDVWFAAAAEAGIAAELQALTIHRALAAVPALPAGTFLIVPVRPQLLGAPVVREALAGRSDLRHVVVQLTGHTPAADLPALRRRTEDLVARGALIAVDAAGFSGLEQLATLRPQLVRTGRAPADDADPEPIRTALAEMVGEFAGRIDARLLAGGIETAAELAASLRRGVPLGQGWLLGRPSTGFAPLAPEVVTLVTAQAARLRRTESLASLLRPVRQYEDGSDGDAVAGPPPAVLVGSLGEPLALLLQDPRTGETYRAPVSLRVPVSADVEETVRRALTRPPAQRFDPVVCTDPTGAVLGLLRIEDLAARRR